MILEHATLIGFIFRLLADIIVLFFVIPLMIKWAFVKNGLSKLRIDMLLLGLVFLIGNTLTMVGFLPILIHGVNQPPLNATIQLINGILFLVMAIIFYRIYHNQYQPDQVEIHNKIAKLEEKK